MQYKGDCSLEHYKVAARGLAAMLNRQLRPPKKPGRRRYEIDLPWSETERYIDEWIHSETARKMLKARLHDEDTTFEQIAEQHHMTVQNAKKKYYRAEERLFSKIPNQFLKDPT